MTIPQATGPEATGAWGRPPRLRPPAGIIDLRGRSADGPAVFRPTPPPPQPPGRTGGPGGRRSEGRTEGRVEGRLPAWRRAWRVRAWWAGDRRRGWVELGVAVLFLAVCAVAVRPSSPAPADARSNVAVLATDIAGIGSTAPWAPAKAAQVQRDLGRAEAAGPPPGADASAAWQRALGRIQLALGESHSDPATARSDLQLAALELLTISGGAPLPR